MGLLGSEGGREGFMDLLGGGGGEGVMDQDFKSLVGPACFVTWPGIYPIHW